MFWWGQEDEFRLHIFESRKWIEDSSGSTWSRWDKDRLVPYDQMIITLPSLSYSSSTKRDMTCRHDFIRIYLLEKRFLEKTEFHRFRYKRGQFHKALIGHRPGSNRNLWRTIWYLNFTKMVSCANVRKRMWKYFIVYYKY